MACVLRIGRTGQDQAEAIPWAEAMADRIPEKDPGPTPTRIWSAGDGVGRFFCSEGMRVAATVPAREPEWRMVWSWAQSQVTVGVEASRMRRSMG